MFQIGSKTTLLNALGIPYGYISHETEGSIYLVANLADGSEDLALCEAIIAMAHKLGIKVIAEGVETRAQLLLLEKSGCDYAQGYHLSHPLDAEAFDSLLRNHHGAEDEP